MFKFVKILSIVFLLTIQNHTVFGIDCTTLSDNTWDCGIPNPSDNLTINHSVTISGNFDPTAIIIINSGGKLTITGNVTASGCIITVKENGILIIKGDVVLKSNCALTIDGNAQFEKTLTIQNSASLVVVGSISVIGDVRVDQGSTIEIQEGSTFQADSNFESNSNDVTIDGIVNIEGDFINNKAITGVGEINYKIDCSGSGTINGYNSEDYCGSNSIDLANLSCNASDITPPEINNLPNDITSYLPNNSCEMAVNWTPPTITDDCELQTITPSHNPGDIFQIGTTTISYSAIDKAGNSNEKMFNITVIDTISPTINNMPVDISQNADAGSCGAAINWDAPTATDNCSASLSSDYLSGDWFPVGVTVVTYTAADLNGNTSTKSFIVTVVDSTLPEITNIPNDTIAYLPNNSCEVVVSWTPPTITDDCELQTVTPSHNPGDVFQIGTTTISYSAIDKAGNSIEKIFNITVIDTISPTINNMPVDINQNADAGSCGAAINWATPTMADNCQASLSSDYLSGDWFPVGVTVVTYTAADLNGNTSTKSFIVTVADSTLPEITNIPNDTIAYLPNNSCEVAVNWTPPTITDDCELQTVTPSHNPGDIFQIGTTTISYSAIDKAGNSNEKVFNITVIDTISPTINNMPVDINQNADAGSCGAAINWDAPTATDNCPASLTSDYLSGDWFPVGITVVTYTAADLNGNSYSKSFIVTVVDKNPPVFSFCPFTSNILSIDTAMNKSFITWATPIVEDACSDVSMSSNYIPGEAFDFGIITIVYTATDQSGNEAQCIFEISSGINFPPVIDDQLIGAKAGEPIDIQIEVTDPEGNQVFIESILHNEDNATITNVDENNLRFVYTSLEDFYGNDTLKVTIIDSGLPPAIVSANVIIEVERNAQIEVSSAMTTNGDFINDILYIKNIDLYPNNSVQIFDRWGGLLYKTKGYDNESVAWNGTSNQSNLGNKEFVPTGTYFYVIDLGSGGKRITGAVEVIR